MTPEPIDFKIIENLRKRIPSHIIPQPIIIHAEKPQPKIRVSCEQLNGPRIDFSQIYNIEQRYKAQHREYNKAS